MKLFENAIETSELTRRFNGLVAVDRLSVSVERGEVFGLLGPNGARTYSLFLGEIAALY